MTQLEAYFFLFTDSVFSNLVISAKQELALYTMKTLGTYDLYLVFAYALSGAVIATILNYLAGIIGYNLYRFSTDQKIQLRYQKTTILFEKYGKYFLFFAATPYFGKFTIFVAGFTRFGLIQTLLYTTISRVLYYMYALYL